MPTTKTTDHHHDPDSLGATDTYTQPCAETRWQMLVHHYSTIRQSRPSRQSSPLRPRVLSSTDHIPFARHELLAMLNSIVHHPRSGSSEAGRQLLPGSYPAWKVGKQSPPGNLWSSLRELAIGYVEKPGLKSFPLRSP